MPYIEARKKSREKQREKNGIRVHPKVGTVIAREVSALQVSAFLFEQPTYLIGVIS